MNTSNQKNATARPCPKCGGPLQTQQRKNVLGDYCEHCGPAPWGKDTKTGKVVSVRR